jgi:periplasmic protein TonB
LLQLSPAPASRSFERLSTGAGRRTLAIGLAVLIEGLMLLLFLSLSSDPQPGTEQDGAIVVTLEAEQIAPAEEQASPPEIQEPAQRAPVPPSPAEPQPVNAPPTEAAPVPAPRVILPAPVQAAPTPVPARNSGAPRPAGPVYGPPDMGRPAFMRDSERVGTAPNGQPLYAAAWYREPRQEMLRDYLSTARGPGWGLIACRTAPDYRVEDCVGIGEYPEGSQIARAVLAAAWEFKVRPPRLGGQSLVGAWVRIRIDWERR